MEVKEQFDKRFKFIVANSSISRFGLSAFNIIIIWVVLFETKNAFLAGLGDGLLSLPLFFSFLIGALIDRTTKKRQIALLVSFLRAVFLVSILYGIMEHSIFLTLASIYASGFTLGLTSDVVNSIRASWTKEVLKESQYKSGSALSSVVTYVAEGAGYLLSGVILLLGFTLSFEIIIFVFLIAVIPLLFVKTSYVPEEMGALESLKNGLNFIKRQRAVSELMIIALILNVTFGMMGIIFISLVQLRFHLPSYFASIVFSIFIFGIIIGSSVAPRVKGSLGPISMASFFIIGLLLASVSFLNSIFLDFIPSLIIGLIIGLLNVLYNASMLRIVSNEYMARISGAFNTFSVAATFSSGMIGGAIIQLTSILDSFIVIGALVIASVAIWPFFKSLYNTSL